MLKAERMNRTQILSALQFHQQMGVDTASGDEPVNWLAEAAPAPAAREPEAKAARPAVSVVPVAPAAPAASLEELYARISSFEGCELKRLAMNTVICDGNPEADVMLIGEAPGADEDRQGKPFVGVSGQLLDRMLSAIGLDRTSVYITNILFWRPPGNRKPNPGEVAQCLPFTVDHIELIRPKVILCAGGLSAQTLLNDQTGITRLRGNWRFWKMKDGSEVPLLPLLHPAFLLRQPARKRDTWRDLLSLKARLDELKA